MSLLAVTSDKCQNLVYKMMHPETVLFNDFVFFVLSLSILKLCCNRLHILFLMDKAGQFLLSSWFHFASALD